MRMFGHVTPGTRLTFMRNVPNLHRIDDLARIPATPCSDGGVRLVRAAQVDRSQSSLTLRLWYMSFTSRMRIPLDCSTLPRDPPRDSHPGVLPLRCTATFNAKVYMFVSSSMEGLTWSLRIFLSYGWDTSTKSCSHIFYSLRPLTRTAM